MPDSARPSALGEWWSKIGVPGYTRWAYVVPALASFIFVGHAWEDAGWQGGGPYAFVLIVSLVQLLRPTVLGWLLCTIPCVLYVVLFLSESPLSLTGEWLAVLLIGLLPALALAWARPRFQAHGPAWPAEGRWSEPRRGLTRS
jgi:hypothetical protein